MRKMILAAMSAALIATSTVQIAAAGEHRHTRKADRAPISEQARNANNSIAARSELSWYSGGYSAPAGH